MMIYIYIMYIVMTPEIIEQARLLRLAGKSPKFISQTLGMKLSSIYKYTANLGVKACHPLYKTHDIQHDFFSEENISKDLSRLVLVGFIAADGCVSEKQYGQKNLIIRLCHKDSNVLEIFNELLALKTRTISKSKLSQVIDFPSDQICKDLSRYGIVPRKTAIYTWPANLKKKEVQNFLLGYFYGDGCYHCAKKRNILHFVCTKKFAEGLREFVYKHHLADHCVLSVLKDRPNYAQIVFQGKNADKFSSWLFQDISLPLLPRKHPKITMPFR